MTGLAGAAGAAGAGAASHLAEGQMGPAPDSVKALPVDQQPNPYGMAAANALKGFGAGMAGSGPLRGISLPNAVASPIQLSALPLSQIHL